MNGFKSDVVKYIICGLLVFSIGLFIGNSLNSNSIGKIQGYLLGASAKDEDDDYDENATDSNATDSNATDSNATDCNATSGDVCDNCSDGEDDDIVYLDNISFKRDYGTAGDTIYLDIETYGAKLNGITITLTNTKTNASYSIPVKNLDKSPYIILPKYLSTSTYEITDVLLTGINSDDTTFSRHYSSSNGNNTYSLDFSSIIKVTALENVTPISMSSIGIKTNKVALGDRVELELKTNVEILSGELIFINSKSEKMSVNLYARGENFFYIPSNVRTGKYKLSSQERGKILDANNNILTDNEPTLSVYAIPSQIENKEECALFLSKYISMDYDKIYSLLTRKSSSVTFHPEGKKLSYEVANLIKKLNLKGSYLVQDNLRV